MEKDELKNKIAIYSDFIGADPEVWGYKERVCAKLIEVLFSIFSEEEKFLFKEEKTASFFPEQSHPGFISLPAYPQSVFSHKRFFNKRLPKLLKKEGIHSFFSLNGILPDRGMGELFSQVLVPDNLSSPIPEKKNDPAERFAKRYFPKYASSAKKIFTFTIFTKKWLQTKYNIGEDAIKVLRRGPLPIFESLNWEEREKVKSKYTDSREFILSFGAISQENKTINLLKAFSILKKKMNSSMMLVIVGKRDPSFKKFPELFRTYHYRKDVKILDAASFSEWASLLGAAYGFVLPAAHSGFCSPIPEALKCRTPIIAPQGSLFEEEGGDAILTFEENDYEALGEQLCALYKDENLRSTQIKWTDKRIKSYSWDHLKEEWKKEIGTRL